MKEYTKIYSPFVRDEVTNKLKKGEWSRPEFEYLKDKTWYGTEKIDGTNIRIMWNGESVVLGGKTDAAQLPSDLVRILQDQFMTIEKRQKFVEKFGEKQVCFYGEGYGAGIQKGGSYRQDKAFILFDVMIDGMWLNHGNVMGIAESFGMELVPTMIEGTLEELIAYVESKPNSTFGNFTLEGIVARPAFVLLNSRGERLITKIKVKDFPKQ
jgi:RNA ligase-like protein